jgi:hypothetical protein
MMADLGLDPLLEAAAQRGAAVRRQAVERARGAQCGLEQRAARSEARENLPIPRYGERALLVGRQRESIVLGLDQRFRAAVELLAQAPLGGGE